MRQRIAFLGVAPSGHPLWTEPEVAPVVHLAPGYSIIEPMLERRTRGATRNKASRLGVAGMARPRWSDNEVVQLRKVYPSKSRDQVLAAFPGRSYAAVAKAANARGIFRSKPMLQQTGFRLLDQVLCRAKVLNLSLADLDRLARSGRYFRSHRWSKRADERFHYIIARTLGGTVRAEFK